MIIELITQLREGYPVLGGFVFVGGIVAVVVLFSTIINWLGGDGDGFP